MIDQIFVKDGDFSVSPAASTELLLILHELKI